MEKTKNIENAFKEIEKKFGKGNIMVLGETQPVACKLLSTGSLLIDQALGGGIAKGRITEIYGVESSGKSTLCLQLAAQCQKHSGRVAYIDVEQALDTKYAASLGVNVNDLIFSQPESAEQALEICDILASSGDIDLIIVDSVAALAPQAELDGDMEAMTIGLLARLMSKALRKLTATLNHKNCAMIFINQLREKVATGFSMGPSETTPGGRALKFFASQRIELRKTTAIKEGETVVGTKVKVKIVKNKIAPPMKSVELPLIFGKGFSADDEIIDLALEYEFISKSGAWLTTHDGQKFCGKPNVKEYYMTNPDKLTELRDMVVEKITGGAETSLVEDEDYEIDPNTGEVLN